MQMAYGDSKTTQEPLDLGALIVLAKVICRKDCHNVCENCLADAQREWEKNDA